MSPYRLNQAMELAIHNWASTVLGITVIWDKQDVFGSTFARRPDLPYATLNILSGPRKVGNSEEIYDSQDTFKYIFRKVFTLTVEVFYQGDGYLAAIEKLVNSLELTTYLDILRNAGIAFWRHEDPVDLTMLLETKHEFRASVDIFMSYAPLVDTEDEIGEIAKVNIKKTNVKTFDIDIPD